MFEINFMSDREDTDIGFHATFEIREVYTTGNWTWHEDDLSLVVPGDNFSLPKFCLQVRNNHTEILAGQGNHKAQSLNVPTFENFPRSSLLAGHCKIR